MPRPAISARPWEFIVDLQTASLLVLLATYGGLALAERIRPGRRLPTVGGWTWRGLLVSAVAYALAMLFAPWFDGWLGPHALIDASSLDVVTGTLLGALFLETLNTCWHLALHRNDTLWRWLHQFHHSTERLDILSAYYFSPLDTAGWTAVASFALTFILGLSVPATVGAATLLTALNFFSHSNLRTPHWLGWFIVRPEMHALHHERGQHRRNYAVLPIIDRVLGTYVNPPGFPRETGFHEGSSARIVAMLCGRRIDGPSS